MSRYERVNLRARYGATPLMSGQAQVHEWEVQYFDPAGAAANSAFFTSRADAAREVERERQQGNAADGPFSVPRG